MAAIAAHLCALLVNVGLVVGLTVKAVALTLGPLLSGCACLPWGIFEHRGERLRLRRGDVGDRAGVVVFGQVAAVGAGDPPAACLTRDRGMTFNWDADCRLRGWKIKWDSFICLETVDLLRWFYSDVDFDKYEAGTLDWFRDSQVIPQNKDELTKTLDERQGYYNSLWSREKEDEMRGLHRLIRKDKNNTGWFVGIATP